MRILKFIRRLFLEDNHAGKTARIADVGQRIDRCGIHRFASHREQAVSDCRRVRLLAQALQDQRSGNPDCSAHDKIQKLIEASKSAGLWMGRAQVAALGELVSKRTGESEVYWSKKDNSFYKVKDPEAKRPLKHTSDTDWVYEHVIHNILFPECAYELVGVTAEVGQFRVVLRQRAIQTETFPTKEMVESELARKGLFREDRYFYGDDVVSVTDVGEHGDNVLLGDDGKTYFIDPLIRLKRPAEDVIEFLTGYNPRLSLAEDIQGRSDRRSGN